MAWAIKWSCDHLIAHAMTLGHMTDDVT